MTRKRTYWHLGELGRKPSAYDIASSKLLYYPERGFEIRSPITEWYERHQSGCGLRCADWERFRDPRETTYASYVGLQRDKEVYVDGLLATAHEDGSDEALPASWIDFIERVIGPLCYPVHGLQMAAAYVGSMAPSGRIVIASAFQAADEIRRVQRITYRICQLRRSHADFATQSKTAWLSDPAWQPLRELIERMLVVYDWGEAFIVLGIATKPRFDALFMNEMSEHARLAGDHLLHKLLASLQQDCAWHAQWAEALLALIRSESDANRVLVDAWLDHWNPRVTQALEPLGELIAHGAATAALHAEPRPMPKFRSRPPPPDVPPEPSEVKPG